MTKSAGEDVLTWGEHRRARRRDPVWESARAEVVDVLFRRHYTPLLRLGVVMLGSREAAEDAVQDAFVALHRHWTSLDDPEAAEAYLRSAVLNRCRSWMRRQVVQRRARPLLVRSQGPATPEDTAVHREEAGSAVAHMRRLPARQRDVLACRYVLELSVAETAALLGISEGSVKVHSHRGLRTLQERMEVDS